MRRNAYSLSVIIPTLNSERVLNSCLQAIYSQDYPREKIEVIVVDAGSTDGTLRIANKYKVRVLHNPLKTGESGKAIGLKNARYELVAFIDSDNILPDRNWFSYMTEPFDNSEIIGSEPIEYTYSKKYGFITRYCAMLGMNDPLCLFLGNYDRKSILTNTWTSLKIEQIDKGNYLEVILHNSLPTIGANGTLFRKYILTDNRVSDNYLFDIDILQKLVSIKPRKFAKVKIGIIHDFCGNNFSLFVHKQMRRVSDYIYYKKCGLRTYKWNSNSYFVGYLLFVLSCITFIPLVVQMCIGYKKTKDIAWLFHLPACYTTLLVYFYTLLLSTVGLNVINYRKKWSQ